MRVIRIGEDPRALRVGAVVRVCSWEYLLTYADTFQTIDFTGCKITISIRRNSIACVADSQSYALLDIDRRFKIPLFPISSNDDLQSGGVSGRVEDISGKSSGDISRITSSAT
jgi:vacuolar protein sorting-associated protein 3